MLKQIGQYVVRWSPLGGSTLAFASFLVKQDWLVAIALFPATVISAVWAGYSKNFIERLTEIYSERAGNHANVVVRWLDSLLETLRWQFSGFEGRYLKLQARPCQEYGTEGFQPDKTAIPMLEEDLLLNFPCEDLKAIDELWVTYSQGKFGFSVQKQIYVACGAKLDGEYPGDKIWGEFCDRVGWRKAGKYLSYKDLQASPSLSPAGEFPKSWVVGLLVGVGGRWGILLGSLLSHKDL